MYQTVHKALTVALTSGLFLTSLALAAPLPGAITAIDKGMATVRTSDGKDHQIKAIEGFKVGAKVECETKNNAMECRAAVPTAAVQPQGQPQVQQPASSQVQQPGTPQAQQPAQSQVQTPAPVQKAN